VASWPPSFRVAPQIFQFTQALNDAVNSTTRQHAPLYIHRVVIEQKQTIMHYQKETSAPFLKIITVRFAHVGVLRAALNVSRAHSQSGARVTYICCLSACLPTCELLGELSPGIRVPACLSAFQFRPRCWLLAHDQQTISHNERVGHIYARSFQAWCRPRKRRCRTG
jgi:hypothetical protein